MKNSTIVISVIIVFAVGAGAWYLLGSGSGNHSTDASHAAMEGADAMH